MTFRQIRDSAEISAYIQKADEAMREIGYTEHSFPHVRKVAQGAAAILTELGFPERTVELARIAGYMHDIGNMVNRHDHAHSGATLAFEILRRLGMEPEEVASITSAIGNHDEETGAPINAVAAALILSDKCDVRRSRVRDNKNLAMDIHDRVNYAVESGALDLDSAEGIAALRLEIDTNQCAVMDYFEIFLTRMLLCRRAAEYLKLRFKLVINGVELL